MCYTTIMKRGGKNPNTAGFTIVETLIVLAVTAVLFISAAALINGRQRKTDFMVGIRDIQQQLQQVINETESGYFPDNASFTCTVNVLGDVQIWGGASAAQGTNRDCIFVGKTLVMGGSGHTDNIAVYTMAGRRLAGDQDVKTLTEARPKVIARSDANNDAPDVLQRLRLRNSIEFAGARLGDGTMVSPANAAGLTIASTLADFAQSEGVVTATQNFVLYRAGDGQPWSSAGNTYSEANTINDSDWTDARIQTAELCFASGGTDQSGLVTIGGSAGGVQVRLDIRNGRTCGW